MQAGNQTTEGGKMTVNICNECGKVWDADTNCPDCGSDDFDMERDTERFDGGIDSDN
jgi:rubrerythrin